MSNVSSFPKANVLAPDDIDFGFFMRESEPQAKVRPATEYLDRVMALLDPIETDTARPRLPFRDTDMTFRPGEVTVWAGFNSSGKSMLQGQVMGHLASLGEKVCIASFEMKPAQTLFRMVRQVCGVAVPAKADVERLLAFWSNRLWLYDQQGSVEPEKVLAVIRYCAQTLGIKQFAVDSLMKCVRGEDDYNGQKDFVNALTVAARDNETHVHLVHHMRKGDEHKMPTRMDLRGSAAIADHVDNVLLLWRNEPKERLVASGQPVEVNSPDALLICDKHRNGEWQGRQKLWFDRLSMSFRDRI